MTHLINRLQFEFNCTDEDQAFNFRQNFATTFQGQIIDAADKICSNHVHEDEWINIEKLEIDLGTFSPAAFYSNFSLVFKSKFEKALINKLSNISSSEKKESLGVSRTALLTYFLQAGSLPWWAGEQEINLNEIILELIANQPATIISFLYRHQTNQNLWIRIAFQLSDEVQTKLILSINELKAAEKLFLKWIEQLNILSKHESVTQSSVAQNMIDDIVLKNAPQIFQNANGENILLEILEKSIATISTHATLAITKIFLENKSLFIENPSEATGSTNENISNALDVRYLTTQTGDEELVIEKYIVKHAGIILLSAFLKAFFTNLQLLNDKEWKNKDAQYKAVHLLKFLSTGKQEMFEYNLTLEKIMCGLAIEEPVPIDVLLEEYETNEAIQLLESVIEHWKALKNTSVNGLRESFLKRDGILTRNENGWLLQVERKTLDVLIDSIPWGYNTIAFSWSEDLIFVEW